MKMETNKNGKITAAILEFFNLLVASIFDIFRRWAEQHRNNIEQHPAASCSHSKNLLHFFHLHFGISEPSFFLRWDSSSIFGFLFDHRLIRFGFQRLLWLWLWFHERTQWLNAIERNWTQLNATKSRVDVHQIQISIERLIGFNYTFICLNWLSELDVTFMQMSVEFMQIDLNQFGAARMNLTATICRNGSTLPQ